MNRAQRRQAFRSTRQRGVGFTRQFSSRRARLQHGTAQKVSARGAKAFELLNLLRQVPAWDGVDAETEPLSVEDEFVLHPDGSVSGTVWEDADTEVPEPLEETAVLEEAHPTWDHADTFDILGGNTFTPTDTPDEVSAQELELLETYLAAWSAKDLIAGVSDGSFDLVLSTLREREVNGKNRVTLIKAIDQRAKQFNTSGVLAPEGLVLGQTTAAELAEILKNR